MTDLTARAKIVAQILTDNGHQVDPPDAGTLDDVEWERWNVCLQIVQAISEDADGDMQEALDHAEEDVREAAGLAPNSYGAGYDTGYRDAMRRALCILRRLDDDE